MRQLPSTIKDLILEELAKDQARRMGLHYMGFGRWGKDGKILYKTYYGRLVPHHGGEVENKNTVEFPFQNPNVYKDENLSYIKGAFDKEKEGDSDFHTHLETLNPGADCLFRQIVHSVAIQKGISAKEIVDKFNPQGDALFGHKLSDIVDGINHALKIDMKVYGVDNIDDAIKVMHEGTPVVAVFDAYGPLMMSAERGGKKVREYRKTGNLEIYNYKDGPKGTMYHAFLLVGYDKAEGRVIFRDTTPKNGFKGYVRVKYEDLKNMPNLVQKYMEIKV